MRNKNLLAVGHVLSLPVGSGLTRATGITLTSAGGQVTTKANRMGAMPFTFKETGIVQ